MSKPDEKSKRLNLSVTQKLELIKKLEKGASVASVCDQYGVKKQTVSDIKSKDKLLKYATSYCVDAASSKGGKINQIVQKPLVPQKPVKPNQLFEGLGCAVREEPNMSAEVSISGSELYDFLLTLLHCLQ
ncbi:unnamed protein product [Clavelina lepadiformis]|uniref:HTH psq-type domain-containing protein n=1 Tax=Clavelina lepadiformis TaxID=159417 RepID=A0ABP0FTW9_CLALP